MKNKIHTVAELGIYTALFSGLVLAGCGGGSGSNTNNTNNVPTASVQIAAFKGKFASGTVKIKDANGNNVTLNNGGTIGSDGMATVTIAADTQFPLLIEVTGNYYNEATKQNEDSGSTPIRSVVPDLTTATSASGVPVTAVTEIAVTNLLKTSGSSALSSASAVTAISETELLLGLNSGDAMKPPVFNADGTTADAYTLMLAALAHSAQTNGTGSNLTAKIQTLANDLANLAAASSPADVPVLANVQTSLTAVTTGADTMVPAGTTAPTVTIAIPTLTQAAIDQQVQQLTQLQQAIITAGDHYVRDATVGVHELWQTGEPTTSVSVVASSRKLAAGSIAGSYTVTQPVNELTNLSWVTKTSATETFPFYILNARYPSWTTTPTSYTWQRNADGTFTTDHPRWGQITFKIVETDITGQPIIDQLTNSQFGTATFPAGSLLYTQTGAQTVMEVYRLYADKWNVVTDSQGVQLTAFPSGAPFCVQNSVLFTPISQTQSEFRYTNSCTAADIAAVSGGAATGQVTVEKRTVGNESVVVIVSESTGINTWLVNSIIGLVNGKLYTGDYKPAGSTVGWIYDMNLTATNAALAAAATTYGITIPPLQ